MANVEEVLRGALDAAGECGPGEFPSGLGRLDERLAAAGKDLAAVLSLVLSALGRTAPHGAPGGYRETGADTLFGHVRFTCAYYGPAPESMSRQMRRARERAAEIEATGCLATLYVQSVLVGTDLVGGAV